MALNTHRMKIICRTLFDCSLTGVTGHFRSSEIPAQKDGVWEFEFRSESQGVFEIYGDSDPLAGLRVDCEGVPMMLNLTEQPSLAPTITTNGEGQNIWFIAVNNTLD